MNATSPSHRPRLLFLCQTLPFPPDGGVSIRTYNVLRLLSASFDITGLFFYRTSTRATPAQVEAGLAGLRELAEVEAFPIPQEHSRVRFAWDHLRSVTRRRVYTTYSYYAEPFGERVKELVRTRSFDLVHVDSLDLSGYLPLLTHLPVVCVHHNVESQLLLRRAGTERTRVRAAYIRLQAELMDREEQRWCPRVALNVTVSAEDSATLRGRIPGANYAVVPNGVDIEAFRPSSGSEGGVVFVGGTTWFPNRDGLTFFSEEILPLIRSAGESAPVWWVGRASEEEKQRFSDADGLLITGYVDDIRPYVQNAACYVVPLRVGGGTRLKILDAWAMGKAVVSTSVGCEGLDARDGDNILIRDTPADFADAVRRVLHDSGLRQKLGRNARATAERLYSWEGIGEKMIEEYTRAMRGGGLQMAQQSSHSPGGGVNGTASPKSPSADMGDALSTRF